MISTCSLQFSRESRMTPRYLTDVERCKFVPYRRGSKNIGGFLLVNAKSPVLSGLTDGPSPSHHVSTVWRTHCMSHDTVFGNFPTARRQMSSAYPCEYTPPSLSLASNSLTRHHRRSNRAPPCGQPLDTEMLLESPPRAAVASRPSRVALIHRTMV